MNIQDKPDYKVFASEARGGEVTDFPNLERGWGETIDKTEKIPPMEWFNLVGKRADEWLLYLTQRGVAEWDAKVKYPQYAMCQLGGKFYIAIGENENKNPTNSQSVWVDLAKYLGVEGKLDASKVVQDTGQSTSDVMSQKSVTDLFSGLNKNSFINNKNGWWQCGDTGIIIQWGLVNGCISSSERRKFPKTFKVSCFQIVGGYASFEDYGMGVASYPVDRESFVITTRNHAGYPGNGLVRYIAIGY